MFSSIQTCNLDRFEKISFDNAKKFALSDRIESKYTLNIHNIEFFIQCLYDEGWKIQFFNDSYIREYHNIYYDTPLLDIYNAHYYHEPLRQKIRVREYETEKFLEIKEKYKDKLSHKRRKKINESIHERDKWMSKHFLYDYKSLIPVIENRYNRITFINNIGERITIDFNIEFNNFLSKKKMQYNEFVIEYKHLDQSYRTNVFSNDIFSSDKFSKYWNGILMTE